MSAPVISKKTAKNQLTLPIDIVRRFPEVDYFSVYEEGGRIILEPFVPSRADEVRRGLEALGITEADVEDAVQWARKRS